MLQGLYSVKLETLLS